MGNCGEVWIFNCEYDWEDVMGMEIGMKIKFLYFSVHEVNRTQRILNDDICDSGFFGIEDAKFLREASSGHRKGKM